MDRHSVSIRQRSISDPEKDIECVRADDVSVAVRLSVPPRRHSPSHINRLCVVPDGAMPNVQTDRAFVEGMRAGTGSLEELLTTALSELCKVKPEGLDAVR